MMIKRYRARANGPPAERLVEVCAHRRPPIGAGLSRRCTLQRSGKRGAVAAPPELSEAPAGFEKMKAASTSLKILLVP